MCIAFSGLVGDFGLAGWTGASRSDEQSGEKASETTGGDDEPVKWVPVATAMGHIEANLIAGRLQSEGIPARISQEAAGAALGLSVGAFQIRVMVPEAMAEQALLILSKPAILEDDEWQDEDSDSEYEEYE